MSLYACYTIIIIFYITVIVSVDKKHATKKSKIPQQESKEWLSNFQSLGHIWWRYDMSE